MISEFFIDLGFSFADKLFDKLPTISWDVNTSSWEFLLDFLDMVAYLLPMNHIRLIAFSIIAITFVRICIAAWRALLDMIPFA